MDGDHEHRRPENSSPLAHVSQEQRGLRMRRRQRGPVQVLAALQTVAADVRGGADGQLREGMGLVLLDVGDGEERAVELEVGIAGWHLAEEGVRPGLQLFGTDSDVSGLAGELLDSRGVSFVSWLFSCSSYIPRCEPLLEGVACLRRCVVPGNGLILEAGVIVMWWVCFIRLPCLWICWIARVLHKLKESRFVQTGGNGPV